MGEHLKYIEHFQLFTQCIGSDKISYSDVNSKKKYSKMLEKIEQTFSPTFCISVSNAPIWTTFPDTIGILFAGGKGLHQTGAQSSAAPETVRPLTYSKFVCLYLMYSGIRCIGIMHRNRIWMHKCRDIFMLEQWNCPISNLWKLSFSRICQKFSKFLIKLKENLSQEYRG